MTPCPNHLDDDGKDQNSRQDDADVKRRNQPARFRRRRRELIAHLDDLVRVVLYQFDRGQFVRILNLVF